MPSSIRIFLPLHRFLWHHSQVITADSSHESRHSAQILWSFSTLLMTVVNRVRCLCSGVAVTCSTRVLRKSGTKKRSSPLGEALLSDLNTFTLDCSFLHHRIVRLLFFVFRMKIFGFMVHHHVGLPANYALFLYKKLFIHPNLS